MEAGVYAWPDGRSPVTLEGKPRVSPTQALKDAGYSDYYAKKVRGSILKDPYYLEQKALIEHQRAGGLIKALMGMQERTGAISLCADRLVGLLQENLQKPEWCAKIPPAVLLKAVIDFHNIDCEVQGALARGRRNEVAAVLASATERQPKETRDRIEQAQRQFHEQKINRLQLYARVGDALDNIVEGEAVEDG